MPEVSFANLREEAIQRIQKVVDQVLNKKQYNPLDVQQWVENIAEESVKQLSELQGNFKYAVTSVIQQKADSGLHMSSSTYWDTNTDGHCSIKYDNASMFCCVNVFAMALQLALFTFNLTIFNQRVKTLLLQIYTTYLINLPSNFFNFLITFLIIRLKLSKLEAMNNHLKLFSTFHPYNKINNLQISVSKLQQITQYTQIVERMATTEANQLESNNLVKSQLYTSIVIVMPFQIIKSKQDYLRNVQRLLVTYLKDQNQVSYQHIMNKSTNSQKDCGR